MIRALRQSVAKVASAVAGARTAWEATRNASNALARTSAPTAWRARPPLNQTPHPTRPARRPLEIHRSPVIRLSWPAGISGGTRMAELSVHQSVLLTDLASCVNRWRLFSPGWYVCVMAKVQLSPEESEAPGLVAMVN